MLYSVGQRDALPELSPDDIKYRFLRLLRSKRGNANSLDLVKAARELGVSWTRDLLPELEKDPRFASDVADHLEEIRFKTINDVYKAAQPTARKVKKRTFNLPAAKTLLDILNAQSVIRPKAAPEPQKVMITTIMTTDLKKRLGMVKDDDEPIEIDYEKDD
jgi:hypothetical protein